MSIAHSSTISSNPLATPLFVVYVLLVLLALFLLVNRVYNIKIFGTVERGYEMIRYYFAWLYAFGIDRNSQLVVYVDGEKVVDIFGCSGSKGSSRIFGADSLVCVWSNGKTVASILLGMLGKVDFDERVGRYWPEFGKNGKDFVKVKDVLRHEAGLQKLKRPIPIAWTQAAAIRDNKIGQVIEDDFCEFTGGYTRVYHGVTRDWITNEIFRRTEPSGLTMGQYLRTAALQSQFDGLDVFFGVPEPDLPRCFDFRHLSSFTEYFNLALPSFLGRLSYHSLQQAKQVLLHRARQLQIGTLGSKKTKSFDISFGGKMKEPFNSKELRQSETPSRSGYASARGLAKLASMMANRGSFGGKQIMTEKMWEEMHSEATLAEEPMNQKAMIFTKGGFGKFDLGSIRDEENSLGMAECLHGQREGWYGWIGAGGAVMQWHPELRIGFAYVPTDYIKHDFHNNRAGWLQKSIVNMVKALKKRQKKFK